ncbi:hypothetical protein PULV_a3070 [Pseudoalteromonas ulvae UL12]|uniref:hypothetical protein n=1 Tax=Pseudoalteromonas ulvae TaxID=107327 RepID=UPI00186B8435|nr:hypothetical protein [Pseudoalteromonas ulvae]MBE0362435.1 hypothetical protein [Pseudoalteromonas ulvae UL12]
MYKVVLALPLVITLSGCGSSIPLCDDGEVTDLVSEIVFSDTREQFFQKQGRHNGLILRTNYAQSLEYKSKDEMLNRTIDEVDEFMDGFDFEISSIRTNSQNEESKSSSCAADLVFSNGNKHGIKYATQLTSESEVYVEVYGLR